jgi:hypothetical protein
MQDAVEGVLCVRMSGQIIENFWRWRWKWRIRRHTLECESFCIATDVPPICETARAAVSLYTVQRPTSFNSSSENGSLDRVPVVNGNAPLNSFGSVTPGQIHPIVPMESGAELQKRRCE